MFLIQKVAWVIAMFATFVLLSIALWFLKSDPELRSNLRAWWRRKVAERRTRRDLRRSRKLATEFNPRTQAYGEFHKAPTANGHAGHSPRQPYRVRPLNGSTAGAFSHLREVRRLDSDFGG